MNIGVARVDGTPVGRSTWGRVGGLVVVVEQDGQSIAICALDAGVVPQQFRAEVAALAGWSPDAIFVLPGGAEGVVADVERTAAGICAAWRERLPSQLGVGWAAAWSTVEPRFVDVLLEGQRLRRSPRQLGHRWDDPPLAALVDALSGGLTPPPGLPWSALLVDARVWSLSVWGPSGHLRGVVGRVAGRCTAQAVAGVFSTPGVRGAAARAVATRLEKELGAAVPVVVVGGGEGHARLGPVPGEGDDAGALIEAVASTVADRVLAALQKSQPVARVSIGWTHGRLAGAPVRDGDGSLLDEPSVDAVDEADVGVLDLGDTRCLAVSGRLSEGMRLRLSADAQAVLSMGPVGGDAGTFATPREAHYRPRLTPFGDEQGTWLVEKLSTITPQQGAPVGKVPAPAAEIPTVEGAGGRVTLTMRRGKAEGRGQRSLDFEARWSIGGALCPASSSPELVLCWADEKSLEPILMGGVPVDDLMRAFRVRIEDGQVTARLRLPEPRRWTGRRVCLRVGAAYGGPMVSAPCLIK